MWVSSSAARGPPTRGNSRHAGVAQSVAQLSCKQQVRGSSPLASSKFLVRPAFLFWILDRPPGNPQLSDPIVLVLLQPGVTSDRFHRRCLPIRYPEARVLAGHEAATRHRRCAAARSGAARA
jgi:hypothetical protein